MKKNSKEIIKKKLMILVESLQLLFPDPKTELYYTNEFQLLIAIMMSAQATDKQVNKVNQIFFQHLTTPQDGVDLGIAKITQYINSLSFFNNKAKSIYATCQLLVKNADCIPQTLEELQQLPGVGVKTAKVFLSITQDAPYLGVDTHVHRVLNRFGIVNTKTPEQTDTLISSVGFDGSYAKLHHTLVLFGRYYSKANDHDFSKSKDPDFCIALKKKLDAVV